MSTRFAVSRVYFIILITVDVTGDISGSPIENEWGSWEYPGKVEISVFWIRCVMLHSNWWHLSSADGENISIWICILFSSPTRTYGSLSIVYDYVIHQWYVRYGFVCSYGKIKLTLKYLLYLYCKLLMLFKGLKIWHHTVKFLWKHVPSSFGPFDGVAVDADPNRLQSPYVFHCIDPKKLRDYIGRYTQHVSNRAEPFY